MRATPLLVFDLDGTLIDTAPDLIDALNTVFSRESLPPVPYDSACKLIGGGTRMMVARGAIAKGRVLPRAELDRLFTDFIAHYAEHLADRSRPFPGLMDALDALAGEGCHFAICTNKLEQLSLKLLNRLGLAERFAAICGQDTFGMQKPDPEMLRRTIAAAGGKLPDTIMIGDSLTDVRTAQAAGVPIVAVDFGYSESPVAELNPDRIISRFAQLPAVIAELNRSQ